MKTIEIPKGTVIHCPTVELFKQVIESNKHNHLGLYSYNGFGSDTVVDLNGNNGKGTYNTIADAKRNNLTILKADDYLKSFIEEKPKKKVTVKATSLEANKKKDKASDQKLILSVLSNDDPLTFGEIAKKLGWIEPIRVSRRMLELVSLGKVKVCIARKCKVRGTNCTTYVKIV